MAELVHTAGYDGASFWFLFQPMEDSMKIMKRVARLMFLVMAVAYISHMTSTQVQAQQFYHCDIDYQCRAAYWCVYFPSTTCYLTWNNGCGDSQLNWQTNANACWNQMSNSIYLSGAGACDQGKIADYRTNAEATSGRIWFDGNYLGTASYGDPSYSPTSTYDCCTNFGYC